VATIVEKVLERGQPAADAVAQIALSLPERPTSGDLLEALTRAETAGYERGKAEQQIALLRRQAG